MEKIKVLVVVTAKTGLQYHRQLVPHFYLSQDEDFQIMMTSDISKESDEELKTFQIVHFLREVDSSLQFRTPYIIDRLRKFGIKIILDLDDYWRVKKTHNLNNQMRLSKYGDQVEQALKLVDYVTTTHEHLAKYIRPFNDNIVVIPNAINPEEHQFQRRKIENSRVRFGWIGGVHHRPDIELMSYSLMKMYTDRSISDKFQICLGGFNTVINFSHENKMQLEKLGCDTEAMRTMSFAEMVNYLISKNVAVPIPEYTEIEKAFTNDHKAVKSDKTYLEYLKQYTPAMEHIGFDKPYRRLWGTDTFNYGNMYNEIDVALVPLVDNEFNNCKSQLKIIEAGFMGKAAIVSNVHPYTIDCVHEKNCLMVNKNMNQMDWFLNMKRLVNEPNLREDLAAALYETVKEKYHIKTTNETRKQLYRSIVG
jgi:hypothetical protein